MSVAALTVLVAGTDGVGASNHSSASTGAPGTSVTTTGANSLLFGTAVTPFSAASPRTPASGQRLLADAEDLTSTNGEWTQAVDVPVPGSGTAVTVGSQAPTNVTFNAAAVEVKAAGGGATQYQTAGYNALDELTSLNGSSSGLSYDGDGNETANPGAAVNPGSAYAAQPARGTSYNDRDQQIGITPAGGDAVQNFFLGETNTTSAGVYDPTIDSGIAQTNSMLGLVNDTNTGTSSSREFLRTPDGLVIGGHVSAGSSYFLTDNLGSTVAMVDGTQHVQASYAYDPAGNTRTVTGTYVNLSDNPIRYAGGYQTQIGTGLTKFGARYYDPNTGRFTQQDPSGQEDNPYTYAGNNPINFVDPTGYGLLSNLVTGAVGSFIGGALGTLLPFPGGTYVGAAVGGCIGGSITGGLEGCGEGAAEGLTGTAAGDAGSAVGTAIKGIANLL